MRCQYVSEKEESSTLSKTVTLERPKLVAAQNAERQSMRASGTEDSHLHRLEARVATLARRLAKLEDAGNGSVQKIGLKYLKEEILKLEREIKRRTV